MQVSAPRAPSHGAPSRLALPGLREGGQLRVVVRPSTSQVLPTLAIDTVAWFLKTTGVLGWALFVVTWSTKTRTSTRSVPDRTIRRDSLFAFQQPQ